MQLETVETPEEFEPLAAQWDALVLRMPRPSPFMLHAWVLEWWRQYARPGEMAVHVAREGDRILGALPAVVRSRGGLRIASLPGGRLSVLCDVLLDDGADPSVAQQLAQGLARADVIDLYGVPRESRLANALDVPLVPRLEAPVLELDEDWYRRHANSKKRNLHRRRRRQLAELGEVSVATARSLDDLRPALEEAFELHELRWDGRPDGSGFALPRGRAFHTAVLERLARDDRARITMLRLDGRAIAFHYWFALAGVMYVHRLAFDPRLARVSPGLVNTLDAVEAAAAEGLRRVEFLGGGERYKLELADRLEPLYHGMAAVGGLRGRAYSAGHHALVRTRMRLKRSERLRRLYMDGLAPLRRAASRAPRLRGAR